MFVLFMGDLSHWAGELTSPLAQHSCSIKSTINIHFQSSPEHCRLWRPGDHALERDGLPGGLLRVRPRPDRDDGTLADGQACPGRHPAHGVGRLAHVQALVGGVRVGDAKTLAVHHLGFVDVDVLLGSRWV